MLSSHLVSQALFLGISRIGGQWAVRKGGWTMAYLEVEAPSRQDKIRNRYWRVRVSQVACSIGLKISAVVGGGKDGDGKVEKRMFQCRGIRFSPSAL